MQRTCHKTIVIHPHTGQFVINELPTLVLCGTVWVYGGMEGLPLTAIATVIALILSLLLLYRYLYLRRIRYCIIDNTIQPDIHTVFFCQRPRIRIRAYVESDN